jgi:hypothetical protein
MARELGMNPRRLGKLDNHKQEPWKAPLPQFIEYIYEKRFGRTEPEHVVPIEEYARQQMAKRNARRAARDAHQSAELAAPYVVPPPASRPSRSGRGPARRWW